MNHSMKKNDPDEPAKNSKPGRKKGIGRPVFFLLNLIIAGLILSGLFLILQPYYLHWQQDRKTAELMKSIREGDGTIVISPDELVVPGEEIEFIDQMEELDQTTASSSGSVTPAATETGTFPSGSETTGPAQQSTTSTTVKPTPKPTPKPIVITAIGQINIDKIGLTMPIADRAESAQLRVAVGHLSGSAMLGMPGNTIIFGHRMYTYGRHFNRLDEVVAGDLVVIVTKTRRLTYQVERQAVILPTELRSVLSGQTTEKQLILVTCTPVRVASHRLLVFAKLISDNPI